LAGVVRLRFLGRRVSVSGFGDLRVLLADDNAHMRSIVSALLKSIGISHIRQANDGDDAFEALNAWPADVAIVDLTMDGADGIAFTRQVRHSPASKNPYLPVVMLTAQNDRGRIIEARNVGVTELIAKPVTVQSVIARLNSVIYHPRPFVRTESYFGPCRRMTTSAEYRGPERRGVGRALRLSA